MADEDGSRSASQKPLVRGGQVYDHDGDVHKPAIADILIDGNKIVSIGADAAGADARV
jgi:hypothetical protein